MKITIDQNALDLAVREGIILYRKCIDNPNITDDEIVQEAGWKQGKEEVVSEINEGLISGLSVSDLSGSNNRLLFDDDDSDDLSDHDVVPTAVVMGSVLNQLILFEENTRLNIVEIVQSGEDLVLTSEVRENESKVR